MVFKIQHSKIINKPRLTHSRFESLETRNGDGRHHAVRFIEYWIGICYYSSTFILTLSKRPSSQNKVCRLSNKVLFVPKAFRNSIITCVIFVVSSTRACCGGILITHNKLASRHNTTTIPEVVMNKNRRVTTVPWLVLSWMLRQKNSNVKKCLYHPMLARIIGFVLLVPKMPKSQLHCPSFQQMFGGRIFYSFTIGRDCFWGLEPGFCLLQILSFIYYLALLLVCNSLY